MKLKVIKYSEHVGEVLAKLLLEIDDSTYFKTHFQPVFDQCDQNLLQLAKEENCTFLKILHVYLLYSTGDGVSGKTISQKYQNIKNTIFNLKNLLDNFELWDNIFEEEETDK